MVAGKYLKKKLHTAILMSFEDHVGLTNDYFSYLKEKLSDSDQTNIIRILMDHEKLTYEEAKGVIEKKIRQKEADFIPAGLAVLNDPELGKDPEVHRWIASLPYCMGGNNAWSQEVSCETTISTALTGIYVFRVGDITLGILKGKYLSRL